ncbi:MAG: hypothetical protein JKY74_12540 [Shewanella sp.]|nr:hypothetical protein [Shewanella sp.]
MMPIPNYQAYMRSVLEQIADGAEHQFRQIVEGVCDEFKFTDEQRALKIPSGKSTYANGRIGWAKTYLVQAGLIKQPRRSYCVITERGLQALRGSSEINNKYLEQFSEFIEFKNRSNKPTSNSKSQVVEEHESELTPSEVLENTMNTLNASLASTVLDAILNASPQFFENLVVDLMVAMGYGGNRKLIGVRVRFSQDYNSVS